MHSPAVPRPDDPNHRVVLLDRVGCHLCDQARPLVLAAADRAGTGVEVRDVDEDPSLQRDWGDQVPVVIVDGRVHARYRVDPESLSAALRPGPFWRRFLPRR